MTRPFRSASRWADTLILIGSSVVAGSIRGHRVGEGMPQVLEVLAERPWGNDMVPICSSALLVLSHVETRGERRTAGRIATYVIGAGLAAYPAIVELVAHGSPLRAVVRSLPVLLAAGLMYLGLEIKDRILRQRAAP